MAQNLYQYQHLRLNGPISMQRVEQIPFISHRILLMGMTGTGKSTFIESFADDKSNLQISADQLEGVTQEVAVYHLVNVTAFIGDPIYLIDTPGLSDRKNSELKIVNMIQDWMRANNMWVFSRIMYFDCITDSRMPDSKKRTLDIFKTISGPTSWRSVSLITTMWDQLLVESGEAKKKAERRFQDLQQNYWNVQVEAGMQCAKFENTQRSALDILHSSLSKGVKQWFDLEMMLQKSEPHIRDAYCGPSLHQNLLERINMLHQRCQLLDEDLQQNSTQKNQDLADILRKDKREAETDLADLVEELEDYQAVSLPNSLPNEEIFFGPPPQVSRSIFNAAATTIPTAVRTDKRWLDRFRQIRDDGSSHQLQELPSP